jgi:hypothetical protein
MTLTFPNYTDQYAVIVAADGPEGEILYSRSMMHHAKARGHVYEFSPGIAPRREVPFPRPIGDYPATASAPLTLFPADWIGDDGRAVGNSTMATLGDTPTTLPGTRQADGTFLFQPGNDTGDEQKMLNIFYFCNYMHDFLYILGFDEAAGNFQKVNFTNLGLGNDPVRARAHSGAVMGDAYPFNYGQLADSPEVHDMGEVWCAALMKMTRLIRAALGDDTSGYRLSWQLVVDALKVMSPNPTFLDGRDAILRTLDDLLTANRIPADVHRRVKAVTWRAFAAFGMGVGASSVDADVFGITADTGVPPDLVA